MATFTINPANSAITTADSDPVFDDDTAGADTLIVNVGAFLVARGDSVAVNLANTLAWKVTVNGWVSSGQGFGLFLAPGNTAASTITVGADGEIGGFFDGVFAQSAVTVSNSGLISGGNAAVHVSGAATITNSVSGIIEGSTGIQVSGAGARKVTNAGSLTGGAFSFRDLDNLSNDDITNSGTIIGEVRIGGGNNSLTNTGTIQAQVTAFDGNDTIKNSKTIAANLVLGNGDNTVTNSGLIAGLGLGFDAILTGTGNDTVTNSKDILGDLTLGDGTNKVTNSGKIDGNIILGTGNDAVTNTGTITGSVTGGSGIDNLSNKGTIGGVVDLGDDNDIYTGGTVAATVIDGSGADSIKFGTGGDTYLAKRTGGTDGTDTVDGGAGTDTYDANNATGNLFINLDKFDHDLAPLGLPGAQLVLKNTANGGDVDGGGITKDAILNFENAKGGAASDTIYGSATANVLEGNGGGDTLFGFGGNDTLTGGTGLDTLVGGVGRDVLNGGLDTFADRFVFTAVSDSTVGKAGRDQIVGFEDGVDIIDLLLIDARTGTPGDQSFTYLNVNGATTPAVQFTGGGLGGELRSVLTATGFLIEGDVNGDGKADFAIDIVDPTHSIVLTSADFFL